MTDFLAGLSAIIGGAYAILQGLMLLGLIGVFIMVGFGLLGLISSKTNAAAKKFNQKHGFLRLHDTTDFAVSSAIKYRREEGYSSAVPADGETTPDILCSSEKPIAVIKFDGDTMATGRKSVARLIDEIIVNKDKFGGAVVVVASPGGGVAEYGQLYAEMVRLRNADIFLTVCVDTYAASGGYLMSLPANRIVAAPFSIVGSIGVVAEFLNFHEFLKNLGIQPLTLTAGARKRTLTQFGEVTAEKEEAFKAQLAAIHAQFKSVVCRHRPRVDADVIGNGDHWTAQRSIEEGMGLVDEIATSSEYLLKLNINLSLVFLSEKSTPFEKALLRLFTGSLDHVIARLFERASTRIG